MTVGLASLAAGLVTAQPAAAASGLTPVPYSDLKLSLNAEKDFRALGAAVQGVESQSGAVSKVSALSVAQSRQHTGQASLCHNTGLDGSLKYDGFCWDKADDTSNSWSPAGGWTPQGLTGSHDASPSGTVDGHHLYVASWYWGNGPADADRSKFGRISIAESTGTSVTYGHVMLVRPTGTGASANFTEVKNVHADGVVWYGNKLFVANGGELQVYDMRHLWKMDSRSERTGIVNGVSSARWHDYALPMVARYQTVPQGTNVRACAAATGNKPCLGSLSLDRSKTPDALVSGEYRGHDAGGGGRVIRWNLNDATALPEADGGASVGSATADAAYASPVFQMQGVATDGTYYYMSGECPTGWVPDPDAPHTYSCIHRAKVGAEPHVLTKSPPLTQNLSYAPSSGRLWGLNEEINTSSGKRVVFSLDPTP
ncbi:hypothetical protein ADL12_02775 [Streptomyces regalis]|uniref:Ricin B lectin domain-containing protein n=1 Tax=Streptomyces regalis TaxID=68262 RepID=A0A0X3VN71_9ACTN|nr:hypothetical protein ADL12_02775 [Streptomyces regalis]